MYITTYTIKVLFSETGVQRFKHKIYLITRQIRQHIFYNIELYF